jgi:hypothetical protein
MHAAGGNRSGRFRYSNIANKLHRIEIPAARVSSRLINHQRRSLEMLKRSLSPIIIVAILLAGSAILPAFAHSSSPNGVAVPQDTMMQDKMKDNKMAGHKMGSKRRKHRRHRRHKHGATMKKMQGNKKM